MGLSALLLSLALTAGCKHSQPAPGSRLERSVSLFRAGHVDEALKEADAGLRETEGRQPELYWALYLQRAEAVRVKEGPNAARVLLQKELPDGPQFGGLRARRKLDQGWIEYQQSHIPEAERLWNEGFHIAEAARDQKQMASIEFSQAQLWNQLDRASEAEAAIQDANRRAASIHDEYLVAYGLGALGFSLADQSQYEDALNAFEREYALLSDKNGRMAVDTLTNMALCRYRLGELDEALKLYQRLEKITSDNHDQNGLQVVLGNIGNLYLDRGELAIARDSFERAARISASRETDHWTVKWLGNIAKVYIQMRDWRNASAYNDQALVLAKKLKDATAQLYLLNQSAAILAGRGQFAAAEALFKDVSRAEPDDPSPPLDAYAGLAELHASQGHDAQADQEYQAAIQLVEHTRSLLKADEFKLNFLSSLIHLHQTYVDFLMSRGRHERALEVAEASRARILQERLGDKQKTGALAAASYRRIARDSGATLISYWLGPQRSYLWLVSAANIVAYPLPPQEQIRTLVENYRALIENMHDPLNSEDTSGAQLYQMLLAPALNGLPAGVHLIIAPDAALYALNFETLPVAIPSPHYFVEDATISVVPSLNLLNGPRRARSGAARLLIVGNPNSSDDQYPELPYASKEIALVQAHFATPQVTSYQKEAAIPAVYEKAAPAPFRFVHFTAHASASLESPLDSAIILSGKAGANKLTARDVLKHPLNADLVTISACRSAGAKTFAGEGLVGFMWAFFQSGARNIIAGLWDVSDESTPELMDHLYAGLTRGQPPADALRAAKLALMQSNPAWKLPYFWAPFQLYIREPPPLRN